MLSRYFIGSRRFFIAVRRIVLLAGLSCLTLTAQAAVNVSTLSELREVVQRSNQKISMKPGRYTLLPESKALQDINRKGNWYEATEQ